MPAPSGYRYYCPLSDANGTSLANFVCRVDLASSNFDFTKLRSDGADLRVYDVTSDAIIPYWLQDFDPVAKVGRLFFKATLTSNVHRLYFGNSSASSASSFANVFTKGTGFDNSGFDDLTTGTSGVGTATRYAANAGITDSRLYRVFNRSNTATIATSTFTNFPIVREFAPLVDSHGNLVQVSGKYVAFHINQSTNGVAYPHFTSRAESTDLVNWSNDTKVLDAGPGTYDDQGARVASAVSISGTIYLFYTANGSVSSGVALATSTDGGLTWTKQGLVLTEASSGITDVSPVILSGVPRVTQLLDGTWAMLCESRGGSTGYPWKIYGWTLSGTPTTPVGTWNVLNGGNPLVGASNGISTGGCANPTLWQRGTNDFVIIGQAFNGGTSSDLTTFNGDVSAWHSTSLSGTYTAENDFAARINVSPSNFGTENGGSLAFDSSGYPLWYIQDYPSPTNLNNLSNIYRIYPVTSRLGLFTTAAAADASVASMTVPNGTFTAENRIGMGCARSGDNTIYCLSLSNSATAVAPDTSTNVTASLCLAVRRCTYSSGQGTGSSAGPAGNISFVYWDTDNTIHYYSGSGWTLSPADIAGSDCLREIIATIQDDGTNYVLTARYADDYSLIATASIAKTSVKATGSGRAISTGVLFTNTNYGQSYSRQISTRAYAATEPSITVGSAVGSLRRRLIMASNY